MLKVPEELSKLSEKISGHLDAAENSLLVWEILKNVKSEKVKAFLYDIYGKICSNFRNRILK